MKGSPLEVGRALAPTIGKGILTLEAEWNPLKEMSQAQPYQKMSKVPDGMSPEVKKFARKAVAAIRRGRNVESVRRLQNLSLKVG
jgi:hypothetical protein